MCVAPFHAVYAWWRRLLGASGYSSVEAGGPADGPGRGATSVEEEEGEQAAESDGRARPLHAAAASRPEGFSDGLRSCEPGAAEIDHGHAGAAAFCRLEGRDVENPEPASDAVSSAASAASFSRQGPRASSSGASLAGGDSGGPEATSPPLLGRRATALPVGLSRASSARSLAAGCLSRVASSSNTSLSGDSLGSSSSQQQRLCLICLEPVDAAAAAAHCASPLAASGQQQLQHQQRVASAAAAEAVGATAGREAVIQACLCKGDLALRHAACLYKWQRIKGSNICDVCATPIANLPPPPPGTTQASASATGPGGGSLAAAADWRSEIERELAAAAVPSLSDCIFDALRACWIVLIICILIFEMPPAPAFGVGVTTACLFVGGTFLLRWLRACSWHRILSDTPATDTMAA